jgi:hypothetical protein
VNHRIHPTSSLEEVLKHNAEVIADERVYIRTKARLWITIKTWLISKLIRPSMEPDPDLQQLICQLLISRSILKRCLLEDTLKGHWHEKRISSKHIGDALGFPFDPLLYLKIFWSTIWKLQFLRLIWYPVRGSTFWLISSMTAPDLNGVRYATLR